MSDPPPEIDPYHKWLGIPKSQQPATYYRLLGIELFEDDGDVIDAAAHRQVAYLHQLTSGPHRRLTQKLMNEIAAAKRALRDPVSRERYNEKLKSKLANAPARSEADSAVSETSVEPAPVIDTGLAPPAIMTTPVIVTGDSSSEIIITKPTSDGRKSKSKAKIKTKPDAHQNEKPLDNRQPGSPAVAKEESIGAINVPDSPLKTESFDLESLQLETPGKGDKVAGGFAGINLGDESPTTKLKRKAASEKKIARKKPVVEVSDGADEEPLGDEANAKRKRGKKGFWDSNDWRIHVGISAISIIALIIFLVMRDRGRQSSFESQGPSEVQGSFGDIDTSFESGKKKKKK